MADQHHDGLVRLFAGQVQAELQPLHARQLQVRYHDVEHRFRRVKDLNGVLGADAVCELARGLRTVERSGDGARVMLAVLDKQDTQPGRFL